MNIVFFYDLLVEEGVYLSYFVCLKCLYLKVRCLNSIGLFFSLYIIVYVFFKLKF